MDVSTAAKKRGDANKLISQAFVSLKKASGAINSMRIKGFLTVIKKFRNRIDSLLGRAKHQELITEEKSEDLIEELSGPFVKVEAEGISTEETISLLIEARIRLESIKTEILELRKGRT